MTKGVLYKVSGADAFCIEKGKYETIYMNVDTGVVGTKELWHYYDVDGCCVNAVDRGEVVPVVWCDEDCCWKQVNEY